MHRDVLKNYGEISFFCLRLSSQHLQVSLWAEAPPLTVLRFDFVRTSREISYISQGPLIPLDLWKTLKEKQPENKQKPHNKWSTPELQTLWKNSGIGQASHLHALNGKLNKGQKLTVNCTSQ